MIRTIAIGILTTLLFSCGTERPVNIVIKARYFVNGQNGTLSSIDLPSGIVTESVVTSPGEYFYANGKFYSQSGTDVKVVDQDLSLASTIPVGVGTMKGVTTDRIVLHYSETILVNFVPANLDYLKGVHFSDPLAPHTVLSGGGFEGILHAVLGVGNQIMFTKGTMSSSIAVMNADTYTIQSQASGPHTNYFAGNLLLNSTGNILTIGDNRLLEIGLDLSARSTHALPADVQIQHSTVSLDKEGNVLYGIGYFPVDNVSRVFSFDITTNRFSTFNIDFAGFCLAFDPKSRVIVVGGSPYTGPNTIGTDGVVKVYTSTGQVLQQVALSVGARKVFVIEP